jgi:hypothetical protein
MSCSSVSWKAAGSNVCRPSPSIAPFGFEYEVPGLGVADVVVVGLVVAAANVWVNRAHRSRAQGGRSRTEIVVYNSPRPGTEYD